MDDLEITYDGNEHYLEINEKFPNGVTKDKTYTKIYFYSEEKINDGKHWHFNKFNNPKRW